MKSEIKNKDAVSDFIKKITGKDLDSFTVRETGRFLSDMFNELKIKYECKY